MSDERRVKKLNTKKKFVADGVFNAELNAFLTRVLGMEGYAGIEVRATSVSTEIRIKAAKHDELLDKGACQKSQRDQVPPSSRRDTTSTMMTTRLSSPSDHLTTTELSAPLPTLRTLSSSSSPESQLEPPLTTSWVVS